jgi:hypothetical protein
MDCLGHGGEPRVDAMGCYTVMVRRARLRAPERVTGVIRVTGIAPHQRIVGMAPAR